MLDAREKRNIVIFCLLTDALILWIALTLAATTRMPTLVYLDGLWALHREQAVLLCFFLAAMALAGAYTSERITDRFDSVYFACLPLVLVSAAGVILASVVSRDSFVISRRELVLAPLLASFGLAVWRYFLGGMAPGFHSLHRSFFVFGTANDAARIAGDIQKNESFRADAVYATLPEIQGRLHSTDTGAKESFLHCDAVISLTAPHRDEFIALLEFCEKHFARVFIYPSLQDMLFFRRTRLKAMAGIPLVEVYNRNPFSPYLLFKRLFDIGVSLIGLVLSCPVCLATTCAIKLSSPGPLFYSQERMGLNGRHFKLYKFRSMVADAEATTGPMWAKANDARVTPVGKFIRKHRIDEIPQLLNVLKGDMSLIGPRPERPHFHQQFCEKWPLFDRRLFVRPGVTSLSHVLGSYDSEPEDRLRYDLVYISSVSFVLDLKILAATVRVVLGAKGAQ